MGSGRDIQFTRANSSHCRLSVENKSGYLHSCVKLCFVEPFEQLKYSAQLLGDEIKALGLARQYSGRSTETKHRLRGYKKSCAAELSMKF